MLSSIRVVSKLPNLRGPLCRFDPVSRNWKSKNIHQRLLTKICGRVFSGMILHRNTLSEYHAKEDVTTSPSLRFSDVEKTRLDMSQLQGTEVDVRREGILSVKFRFSLAKRPKHVTLRGVVVTLSDLDELCESSRRVVNIENARLQYRRQSRRLILTLTSKEKLSLYSDSSDDFEHWLRALTDAIQWSIQRFYEIKDVIGRGAFSSVRKAIHRETGTVVAVKVIEKSLCSNDDMVYLQREIDIARSLRHQFVAETRECFESSSSLYIVTEYMAGGTLDDIVKYFGKLSETSTKLIMTQLLQALDYVHDKGVVHRDIKPENIMCTRKSLPTLVKLTDFGLARRTSNDSRKPESAEEDNLGPDGLMTTPVGTPNFVAPEVLDGLPYGKEVDLFACGVVMYYCLTGYYPFEDADSRKLVERIKRGDFSFPAKDSQIISNDAKDLISGLLHGSPYSRLSAKRALSHKWIAVLPEDPSAVAKKPGDNRGNGEKANIGEHSKDYYDLNETNSDAKDSPREIVCP